MNRAPSSAAVCIMLASIRCDIANASNPIETAIVMAAARTNWRTSPKEGALAPILLNSRNMIGCSCARRGAAFENTVRSNMGSLSPSVVNQLSTIAHPRTRNSARWPKAPLTLMRPRHSRRNHLGRLVSRDLGPDVYRDLPPRSSGDLVPLFTRDLVPRAPWDLVPLPAPFETFLMTVENRPRSA